MELELNRAWIYNNNGEVIGETNFVIRFNEFLYLYNKFRDELQDYEEDVNEFLDIYEPEVDGEKIYQQALKENLILEDLGIQLY